MIALPEVIRLNCLRRRFLSAGPYTKTRDGSEALGELEKDQTGGTTSSDDLRPGAVDRSSPRQIGLTGEDETNAASARPTAPFDRTIPQAQILQAQVPQAEVPDAQLPHTEVSIIRSNVEKAHEATPHYSAFETPWQDRLLDCLLKMKPAAFERLCQKILKESGFIKVEVTGRSGDGGIDGIGVLRLNLLSFHVFFQCKRWKGSVGASAIRDFRGAMVGRADKGLVMTTGTFTSDARKEATRDGAPAIDLVDGEAVCELLKKLQIGVSIRKVEHVMVQQEAFLEF
jgi:restriction endonuclease Mrr